MSGDTLAAVVEEGVQILAAQERLVKVMPVETLQPFRAAVAAEPVLLAVQLVVQAVEMAVLVHQILLPVLL